MEFKLIKNICDKPCCKLLFVIKHQSKCLFSSISEGLKLFMGFYIIPPCFMGISLPMNIEFGMFVTMKHI